MEKNIYQKLAEARVLLQNSEIKKSGMNSFAKFKYFELQDFLPEINNIFNKLGLISVFNLDEKRAKLTIINSNKTDETLTFYTPTAEADIKGAQAIQKLGGVHTYLKRYLYLNALEIAEHDAIDAVEQKKETKTQPKKEKDFRDKLVDFVKENNLDVKKVSSKFGLNKESSDNDYQKVLANLSTLNDEALSAYANEV